MTQHIRNLLDGARRVLALWPDEDYVRPKRGDFRIDSDNLRADCAHVVTILRANVKKKTHGKKHLRERA